METRDIVFSFIIEYKRQHQGNTPTLAEIATGCNLSAKAHAKYHLDRLVDDNRLTRAGRNIYIPGARWEWGGE